MNIYLGICILVLSSLTITNCSVREIKLGSSFKICSEKKDKYIILDINSSLICAIGAERTVKQCQNNDFTFQNNKLCLNKKKATKSDAGLYSFKSRPSPFTKATYVDEQTVKIYERIKFIDSPPKILMGKASNVKNISCSATGWPYLKMELKDYKKNVLASGKSNIQYNLKLTTDMDGKMFKCVANINVSKPRNSETKSFTVALYKKPQMKIDRTFISTDTGFTEKIKITVTSVPLAKVTCKNNVHNAPVISTSSSPDQSKYIYTMTIKNLSKKLTGSYICEASNTEGIARQTIQIKMDPMNIRLSPTDKSYSNAIPLKWSLNSAAPISKISLTCRSAKKTIQRNFSGKKIDEISIYPKSGSSNNYKRSYMVILRKLEENMDYKITIKVCNVHGCYEEVFNNIRTVRGVQNQLNDNEYNRIAQLNYLSKKKFASPLQISVFVKGIMLLQMICAFLMSTTYLF